MVFKKKRGRVRHFFSKARRRGRKFGGGMLGDVIAGAVVGGAVNLGAGTINKYVPTLGPVKPVTVATLGVGVADKMFLHKGGKFTSAAVVIGAAMLAGDLMSGLGGVSTNGGGGGAYG